MSREILLLVDALAREKNVTRDVVFGALESALASAMKKRFKDDADIRVAIDRETGDHEGFRRWLVVPDEAGLQEPDKQEMLSDAVEIVPNIQVGEYIEEPVSYTHLDVYKRQRLQACLMTQEEMTRPAIELATIRDPFPIWGAAQ